MRKPFTSVCCSTVWWCRGWNVSPRRLTDGSIQYCRASGARWTLSWRMASSSSWTTSFSRSDYTSHLARRVATPVVVGCCRCWRCFSRCITMFGHNATAPTSERVRRQWTEIPKGVFLSVHLPSLSRGTVFPGRQRLDPPRRRLPKECILTFVWMGLP